MDHEVLNHVEFLVFWVGSQVLHKTYRARSWLPHTPLGSDESGLSDAVGLG